jgi:hypothetical protein
MPTETGEAARLRTVCAIICVGILASRGEAETVHVQLLPLTGEVRLQNPNNVAVNFVFYSVKSPAGALDPAPSVWTSIDENYDVSGNGLVDPRGEWIKIATDPVELAEGVPIGPGGTLAAQQTISLGRIWNQDLTPFPDLVFDVIQLDGESANVVVEFGLDGDYNRNGIVDAADYAFWRDEVSTPVAAYSGADGNGDGIVGTDDYQVWRANFGAVLRPDGQVHMAVANRAAVSAATLAIPEPSASVLFMLTLSPLLWCVRRCARRA